MIITNSFIKSIHSEKKNADYLKFVIIADDNSIYTGFTKKFDELADKIHNDELDIIDINYNSALLIIDERHRIVLDKIL